MFTRCTYCETWFAVNASDLRQGLGEVRCGRCLQPFDALLNLHDELPATAGNISDPNPAPPGSRPVFALVGEEAPASPIPESIPESVPDESGNSDTEGGARLDEVPALPAPGFEMSPVDPEACPAGGPSRPVEGSPHHGVEPADLEWLSLGNESNAEEGGYSVPLAAAEGGGSEAAVESTAAQTEVTEVPAVLADDFVRRARSHQGRARRWWQGGAAVLLLGAMVIQYAWFLPDDLVRRYPMARAAVARFCAVAHCLLAPPRDLSAIRLVGRDVRIHPTYQGALRVTAVLQNNAPYAQAFPDIQFVLYNVNGQVIASRRFRPPDYLGKRAASAVDMPSRRPVQIELDLLAPEEAAVSFEFKFI